ncbi:hypothetical protein D5S17_13850 [Pseudonocardiaceae bacterium YIM PH 21723]|nr:hypothetical protein D5S17_13850 [Pseudonocardiaceae bacterium YIM PH 21723]
MVGGVVLLAATQLFGTDLLGIGHGSAPQELDRAATLSVRTVDVPLREGQFRYVRSEYRGITLLPDGGAVASQLRREEWMPKDPHQPWLLRTTQVGKPHWVPGHEGSGPAAAQLNPMLGEWTAPCGGYSFMAQPVDCEHGSETNPTPEFLAKLPSDPAKLWMQLASSGVQQGLHNISGLLATGRIPGQTRSLLYQALKHATGIRVTSDAVNVDGRTGLGISAAGDGDGLEFMVDPDTGQFLGSRLVLSKTTQGFPQGTVLQTDSVRMGVADKIGAAP